MRVSTDAITEDFHTDWYKEWIERIGLDVTIRHGKFWEQAMLYESFKKYGMLQQGKRGLGFGVGREQLVSAFANEGATIVATDQAPEGEASKWDNGQLADGKESLYYPDLIARDTFERNVTFEHHDMNAFERSYVNKFDFAWSNCVIGHLGSMKLSEQHLKHHAEYIRYGGMSVLTTELNISSLTETVADNSGTIIWRLSDLYRVFSDMLECDMVAEPLKLRLLGSPEDRYIYFDVDYLEEEQLGAGKYKSDVYITKIPFSNYAIVQVQIVFVKRRLSLLQKQQYRQRYRLGYVRNTLKLRRFMHSRGDISDYSTKYASTDLNITPIKATKNIKLKPGETGKVTVSFTNGANKPVFLYGLHTPLHVPPLVLATASPVNRDSKLRSKAWFSQNRPSVMFKPSYDASAFKEHCHGYHRALPGETFSYTFEVKAPRPKGIYNEDFCLALEGRGAVPKSLFTLKLAVG